MSAAPVAAADLALPQRPRLRGWIHVWAFTVSVVACTALVVAAASVSTRAALATALYGTTVVGMFGVSALYHRGNWTRPTSRAVMRRLDHSMIFLFIAGTYTPAAVLAMSQQTGTVVLAVVWTGAVVGVAVKLVWPHASRWLGVPIYLALGWVAVFVLPDLLATAGVAALALLLVGGALYTAGGIGYGLRRPHGWPHMFGYHEFFHAATALAATCHYVAIWLVVLH